MTCAGQVIGAIAAETKVQAQRAAKMVKIVYEDLPRILTTEVKFFLCVSLGRLVQLIRIILHLSMLWTYN